MKVLVAGSNGFIGKNLCSLLSRKGHEVFRYDINSSSDELSDYISKSDFIVNVAGVNRPQDPNEFYKGNFEFTKHSHMLFEIEENYPPKNNLFNLLNQWT